MVRVSRHLLTIPIGKTEIPFQQVLHVRVQMTEERGVTPSFPQAAMRVRNYKKEFVIASIDCGYQPLELAERIVAAVLDVTDISREVVREIHQKVLEKPGISHTALLSSVDADRDSKERAMGRLLDRGDLKCEQRGRVRRYFVE